jgi:hypothetical protein
MPPYDLEYLKHREEQIRKLHEGRAVLRGMIAGLIFFALLSLLALLFSTTLAAIPIIITFCMALGLIFMGSIQQDSESAEKAIQKEREQLIALGMIDQKKQKRDVAVELSDDGELIEVDEVRAARKTR